MSAAADGPELPAAKRLLNLAKSQGFAFQRVAPNPDGPLFARRETLEYRDEIYIGGFRDSCYATRARKSSLIVPGSLPVIARVTGDALAVLHTGRDRLAYLRSPAGDVSVNLRPCPCSAALSRVALLRCRCTCPPVGNAASCDGASIGRPRRERHHSLERHGR